MLGFWQGAAVALLVPVVLSLWAGLPALLQQRPRCCAKCQLSGGHPSASEQTSGRLASDQIAAEGRA